MSMHMYLALGVETALFHKILDVVVSAVDIITPPGYSTKFPPTVNLVQLRSSFLGQFSTTMWPYVMFLWHTHGIFSIPQRKWCLFP